MKVIARIILLVVAVFAFVYGIPALISNWNAFNAIEWSFPNVPPEKWALLSAIIGAGFSCLLGLFALVEAIVGKSSFLCVLVALVMIGVFIWNVVTNVQAGTLNDFQSVMHLVAGFGLPIGFSIGTILISFSK